MSAETQLLVDNIYQGCTKKQEYYSTDRERLIEMSRLYWGVDYGHYSQYVVSKLLSEGRQPVQIPLLTNKLDGLRGALIRNQFDIKYMSMDGKFDKLSMALQDMYYSDKETMNWDWSYNIFLRDFLLQFGVEEMVISQRHSKLGNLSFIPRNPALCFPDPNWKDGNGWSLRECDIIGFYTADALMEMFPDKADALRAEKERQQIINKINQVVVREYGPHQSGIPYQNIEAKWGEQHMVIEHHEMRTETRTWEHNIRDGIVPFPETGFKAGSSDDISKKKHYIEQNQLDPETEIRRMPQTKRVYYKTIVCPGLTKDVVLFDGPHYMQIGRLPLFLSTPSRFGSQMRGIADLLKDVQLNTDRYILMMQEILNRSARGAFVMDPAIVGGDAAKMAEFESEWNNGAARLWSVMGASQTGQGLAGYIKELPSNHIPNDLMGFSQLMEGYGDKYSYQTPSTEGRSESSKESGKLYQSKYEAAIISRGVIDRELEIHSKDKAEAYMLQAKITYAGIPRTFPKIGGGKSITVNELALDSEGGFARNNDISALPRQRIIIQPSQRGVDVRVSNRGMFTELKMNERDPLMNAIYDKQIFGTFEMTDEARKEGEAALALITREAALAKAANIQMMELKMEQMGNPPVPPEPDQGQQQTPVAGPEANMQEAAAGTPMQGKLGEIGSKGGALQKMEDSVANK